MMVIYKTTNLINGKYYVGKQKRYTDKYLGSGSALKHALKKYGRKSFKKEILETCESERELQTKELKWLDKFGAIKDKQCYNLVRETSPNKHRSYDDPDYRKTLSQRVRIAMHRPEIHAKVTFNNSGENNPMYGKKRTMSFKNMVSQCQRGKRLTDETKALIALRHIGKRVSTEVKEKMQASQYKRWDNIIIEAKLDGGYYEFFTRRDFKVFVKSYNKDIPIGRVRGTGVKRINWKRALSGEYDFIKIIPK